MAVNLIYKSKAANACQKGHLSLVGGGKIFQDTDIFNISFGLNKQLFIKNQNTTQSE